MSSGYERYINKVIIKVIIFQPWGIILYRGWLCQMWKALDIYLGAGCANKRKPMDTSGTQPPLLNKAGAHEVVAFPSSSQMVGTGK